MITEFIKNHVFMSSILIFGAFSICMQWLMTLSLKGYVKASANMKTTRKKVMVNLKNQFETIYGMDYKVRNIAAYVDKYLLKLRFLGFSFSAWERVPFLTAGIVTLLAGAGVFYGYMTGAKMTAQVEILFAYGMVLVCLFVFFHIFGIKSKKQQIHIQLVDYLENYLSNRLIRTREGNAELKLLDEDMEAAFMEGAARNKELKNVILEEEKEKKKEGEKRQRENEAKQNQAADMEEDMDMLKRLIQEMEEKKALKQQNVEKEAEKAEEIPMKDNAVKQKNWSGENQQEIAVSSEENMEESEIELLEEFVQSFLA
ncbi:MAG: hypothetical protein ACI4A3_08610 [Lachnospiraceae bacterium]